MNPLTKIKLINELNQREARLGVKDSSSWHSVYKDSAWVFVGGFPYELSEGDLVCVFSQYGEIVNINLVRDKKTGKSKGFCFICYEDQRSTVLSVDNLNGIKIKGRTIRVDHVLNYRPPEDTDDIDDVTKRLREEGCAPKLASSSSESEEEEEPAVAVKKRKKDKKEKKKKKDKKQKKQEKKKRKDKSSSSSPVRVKQEREDAGYEKYANQRAPAERAVQDVRREERRDRDQHEDRRVRDRDDVPVRREESSSGHVRDNERARRLEGSSTSKGDHRDHERVRQEEYSRQQQDRERSKREGSDRERGRSPRHRDRSRDRDYRRH